MQRYTHLSPSALESAIRVMNRKPGGLVLPHHHSCPKPFKIKNDRMVEPDKVCSRCGGRVAVEVIRHEREGVCFASFVVGTCRECGKTFNEAEVLALKGPGPVGG